jgi:hypothetical protein
MLIVKKCEVELRDVNNWGNLLWIVSISRKKREKMQHGAEKNSTVN